MLCGLTPGNLFIMIALSAAYLAIKTERDSLSKLWNKTKAKYFDLKKKRKYEDASIWVDLNRKTFVLVVVS